MPGLSNLPLCTFSTVTRRHLHGHFTRFFNIILEIPSPLEGGDGEDAEWEEKGYDEGWRGEEEDKDDEEANCH
jgi:hypothetical protein